MKYLKKYLITGLLIWLPIGLTVWVIKLLLDTVDQIIPAQITESIFKISIPGIGILLVVVILLVTGVIATNFFGRSLLNFTNQIILRIPVVKSIYKGIKQVSDTLLSGNSKAFRRALLVKFPHQNSWTIAFITGKPTQDILPIDNYTDYINVYIPTTPNPTSGYFIMVHKDDTIELNINVDDALKYVISIGTIENQKDLGTNHK